MFPGVSPLWYYRLASNSLFWKYTLQGSISVMLMLTISKALWNSRIGPSDHQPSKTLSKAWRYAAAKGGTNDSVQLQALFPLPLLTCSLLCFTQFQIFQSSAQSLAPLSLFLLRSFRAPVYWRVSFQSGGLLALYLCLKKHGPTCQEKVAADDSALPLSLCGTKSSSKMIRKTTQKKIPVAVVFLSLRWRQSSWKLIR